MSATDRLTYRVTTRGSADAVAEAKRQAKSAGYVIRTVARVVLVTALDGYADDGRQTWDVQLVVAS